MYMVNFSIRRVSKSKLVSGHDFSRRSDRKNSFGLAEVSGHDFSRAVNAAKSTWASAPERLLVQTDPHRFFQAFSASDAQSDSV
jgi:hypothetical protein